MAETGAALERIWRRLLADPRRALEATLPPSDLQTLLMAITRTRAGSRTASDLMRRWREDRSVRPSTVDARAVARVEGRLWDALPDAFAGVELSPVAPLGTCSAVAAVDQHRVLSTTRGTEVVSDLTNALALEAAWRRRESGEQVVHLAAAHRVLRMQPFPPPASQHFRLFALVSTTRDTGGGRAEAQLMVDHLRVWTRVLPPLAPGAELRVELSTYDSPLLRERVQDTVLPALRPLPPGVTVVPDVAREHGRGYYTTAALRILASAGSAAAVELGDGGLTDWTAQLLADAKERCLISCVSTERLCALSPWTAPSARR
jgi:hypothetical protein